MIKYKSLTRTTLDNLDDLPNSGVYVLAYMGRILYVGVASNVIQRLKTHVYGATRGELGKWIRRMSDYCNVRLDVLEPPDNCDSPSWMRQVEAELIVKFNPLFNTALN
jgi:excinuclease UvrABC nuclease subunit